MEKGEEVPLKKIYVFFLSKQLELLSSYFASRRKISSRKKTQSNHKTNEVMQFGKIIGFFLVYDEQ